MLQAVLDDTLVVLATKITTFYNALLEAYLFLNQISLQGTHFYLQHFYDLCHLAISKIHNIYSGMYRASNDNTTLCISMVTKFSSISIGFGLSSERCNQCSFILFLETHFILSDCIFIQQHLLYYGMTYLPINTDHWTLLSCSSKLICG